MELTQLRYFVFAAETGNFRRAAELSHVSPPAMTKAIQKLEEEVGLHLFERTTRRVMLTEEGKAVLARAQAALSQVDAIRHDLDALSRTIGGELRIGANEVFSQHALPRALAKLVSAHPTLRPLSYEMHPEAIVQALTAGHLDVGFTLGASPTTSVACGVLGSSKGRIVCGRNHPLFAQGRIRKADLSRHAFVVPRFFNRPHLPSLDQFPDDRYPRIVGATIELLQMGIELVLSGDFLGYFPEVTIEHHVTRGALRKLVGLTHLPAFDLYVLTRRGAPPKPAVALLSEALRRALPR